jgi:hypothetical protein
MILSEVRSDWAGRKWYATGMSNCPLLAPLPCPTQMSGMPIMLKLAAAAGDDSEHDHHRYGDDCRVATSSTIPPPPLLR